MIKLLLITSACSFDAAVGCLIDKSGSVEKVVQLPSFSKILVKPNIQLILKQANDYKLKIVGHPDWVETVDVTVKKEQLVLESNWSCPLSKKTEKVTVYASAPDLTQIRSETQFDILSDGLLQYRNLQLLSENENNGLESSPTGNFILDVDCTWLRVLSNNFASFYISGHTTQLRLFVVSGDGRFEGTALKAQHIHVFHRGTNQLLVHPVQSIYGEIRSTGDVLTYSRPPTVAVTPFYKGVLRFME